MPDYTLHKARNVPTSAICHESYKTREDGVSLGFGGQVNNAAR